MTMKLKIGTGCPECMKVMKKGIRAADDTSGGVMFTCKDCGIRVVVSWAFYEDETIEPTTTLDDYVAS